MCEPNRNIMQRHAALENMTHLSFVLELAVGLRELAHIVIPYCVARQTLPQFEA